MNNDQKTFYIIAGPNGAGKTTLSRILLKDRSEIRFLNADLIAHGLNLSSRVGAEIEAGRLMLEAISKALEDGETFGFETTLSGRMWQGYIKKAKELGYRISIIYASVKDVETCLQRIAARVKTGGHAVDEATVRRRFDRSREMFLNVYSKMCDEWYLFDNTGERGILIAKKDSDGIEFIAPIICKEFFSNV